MYHVWKLPWKVLRPVCQLLFIQIFLFLYFFGIRHLGVEYQPSSRACYPQAARYVSRCSAYRTLPYIWFRMIKYWIKCQKEPIFDTFIAQPHTPSDYSKLIAPILEFKLSPRHCLILSWVKWLEVVARYRPRITNEAVSHTSYLSILRILHFASPEYSYLIPVYISQDYFEICR